MYSWGYLPKSATPSAVNLDGIQDNESFDCGVRDRVYRTGKKGFECCSAFLAGASIGAFWKSRWIECSHIGQY